MYLTNWLWFLFVLRVIFFNHAIVQSMLILSFNFVTMCCISEWKWICVDFLIVCIYLYCSWISYNDTKKGLARTRRTSLKRLYSTVKKQGPVYNPGVNVALVSVMLELFWQCDTFYFHFITKCRIKHEIIIIIIKINTVKKSLYLKINVFV